MIKNLKIQIPEGYEIDKEQSTFENIVFKKKSEYPRTWKEFCERYPNIEDEYYISGNSTIYHVVNGVRNVIDDANLFKTKKEAEAFLTLIKLYRLRQAYVGDWKPDWIDNSIPKYIIKVSENELMVANYYFDNRSFSFPSRKMAEEFLNNFKADLELVKHLI
jgi:hypothetical protein